VSKKNWDTDWLIFSKRARNGALVFLLIFILVAVAPRLYRNYFGTEQVEIEISQFNSEEDQDKPKNGLSKYSKPKDKFDPNEYTVEDWINVGLSEKQSSTILNYLKKGGKLEYKEDLLKLYVVDQELYDILSPMVLLPSKSSISDDAKEEVSEIPEESVMVDEPEFNGVVEINSASKEELMRIKGIGKYYAEQIIKKRERLGGIASLDQLKDLYMMTPGKLDTLSNFIKIDPDNITRIDVNLASKIDLQSHPFINSDVANSIVFIRERYGLYKSLDDLLQSPYIDAEKLEELKPYLKVK
tara:strand:+ start:51475 stop:52371 length:897 start_codon:yes stop_codon:yes gene_type:complete